MGKSRNIVPKSPPESPGSTYNQILGNVVELLESARRGAARSVNAIITATYWEIGRRIVEFEQTGLDRAVYGEGLLKRLASDLAQRFGRGFGLTNVKQFRKFYLVYRNIEKSQTPSDLFPLPESPAKGQTPSDLSSKAGMHEIMQTPSAKSAETPPNPNPVPVEIQQTASVVSPILQTLSGKSAIRVNIAPAFIQT